MKKIILGGIVLLIIIGGAIALVMHKNSTNNKPAAPPSSHAPMSSANSAPNTQATDKVTISNFSFSPASITVKKGTAVTWTNHDSVAHTVTETDGQSGPQSQDLANGQSYSFTYNSVGTYHYHCSIHPDMTGQVVVTQ